MFDYKQFVIWFEMGFFIGLGFHVVTTLYNFVFRKRQALP